jgi:diguanylate cyclase (GGDEF)-like protein
MLHHPINVLVVAAHDKVARAVEDLMMGVDGQGFYMQRVTGLDAGLGAVTRGGADLVLLDVTPAAAKGAEAINPAYTAEVNHFLRHMEESEPGIPLLVMADETVLDCSKRPVAELLDLLPPLRLDRSRTTPYLLERAMCFSLERARLQQEIRRLRMHDSLTGLLSGSEMDRLLLTELNRCRRYRYPLSILAVQVDEFDEIVGERGPSVGDQILRWVAMIIQENIRTVDRAARYIDSEFLLALPETGAQAAAFVGRRLQLRIAQRPFVLFPSHGPVVEMGVSASVGLVEGPRDNETADGLVMMAERALSEAKRQKRGKVVVYGDLWPA